MYLNTLIIADPGPGHLKSYALELEHRAAGLKALFDANIPGVEYRPGFKEIMSGFLTRGGQIHYVIDPDDRVVGSAYLQTSNPLLQHVYLIARFFVENRSIDHETQAAVANCLLASIVKTAEERVVKYPHAEPIRIQLTFPEGALGHPESRPIYSALEANRFRGVGTPGAELWIRMIEGPAPVEA